MIWESMQLAKGIFLGMLVCFQVNAAVTLFHNDLAGFNAAAGNPPVAIDFDSIPVGTRVGLDVYPGVVLLNPFHELLVVRGTDTYSTPGFTPPGGPDNRLFPTSGEKALSPGGNALAPTQHDALQIQFDTPVKAFGFDILYQFLDGNSSAQLFVGADRFGSELLFSQLLPEQGAPGSAGGSNFYGLVSDSANIQSITVIEADFNTRNLDGNLGYDTFRFGAAAVPEPSTFLSQVVPV